VTNVDFFYIIQDFSIKIKLKMNITIRIKKIREDKKLTITALAIIINEKRQRIQDIEIGKQRVQHDIIAKYIEFFNINANWLITGKGEMYSGSEKQDMKIVKMAEFMEGLDVRQQQEILSIIEEKQQINEMKHQLKQLTINLQKYESV